MTSTMRRTLRKYLAAVTAVLLLAATLLASGRTTPTAEAADPGVAVVYIANGWNFPDALTGAVLAASHNVPLLLVRGPNVGDSIPPATIAELDRLKPENIVIFGGPAAVSAKVGEELKTYTTGTVTRLGGKTRADTARLIAGIVPGAVRDTQQFNGFGHPAFRTFSVTPGAAVVDGEAAQGLDGITLPADGISDVSFSVTLPFDFTPGNEIAVDVKLFDDSDTSCTAVLSASGPGSDAAGEVGTLNFVLDSAEDTEFPNRYVVNGKGPRDTFTARFGIDEDDRAPGSVQWFTLRRSGNHEADDCGDLKIWGFVVHY